MSTGEFGQKWTRYFLLFFSEASERRVENTRVHFWLFSPVSVKVLFITKEIPGGSPCKNEFSSLVKIILSTFLEETPNKLRTNNIKKRLLDFEFDNGIPEGIIAENQRQIEFNRYRRGLETCPKARTSKSGHAVFFSIFRRVRATSMTQRRVGNTRVHFWTFSPVSVKIDATFETALIMKNPNIWLYIFRINF